MRKIILIITVVLTGTLFADEALDKELLKAYPLCYHENTITYVKEMVAKGADVNARISSDGASFLSLVKAVSAFKSNSERNYENCKKITQFLVSKGAVIPPDDKYLDNELLKVIKICSDDYLHQVKRLIEEGADVNAKNYEGKDVVTLASSTWNNCKQIGLYLDSIGAKDSLGRGYSDIKQLQINEDLLYTAAHSCNLDQVKQSMAKGGDINYIDANGVSLFAAAAIYNDYNHSENKERCKNVLRYLSSIGAKDSGHFTMESSNPCPFKNPITAESKYLKAAVIEYYLNGSLKILLENKTDPYEDEYIYIYAYDITVNGKKHPHTARKTVKLLDAYLAAYKPGAGAEWRLFAFEPSSDPKDYPKVVNNRVKFTTEVSIFYRYKGKDYELKIPKIARDVEVGYNLNSRWTNSDNSKVCDKDA
jgi:ankyrin repeat protein